MYNIHCIYSTRDRRQKRVPTTKRRHRQRKVFFVIFVMIIIKIAIIVIIAAVIIIIGEKEFPRRREDRAKEECCTKSWSGCRHCGEDLTTQFCSMCEILWVLDAHIMHLYEDHTSKQLWHEVDTVEKLWPLNPMDHLSVTNVIMLSK